MATQTQILEKISEYLDEHIDPAVVRSFRYRGIMPPISRRDDYTHFPNSKYPFLGPALTSISYADNSIGRAYPIMKVQIVFSNRQSGVDPSDMMKDMLDITEQLQDVLFYTARNTRFDMPDLIPCMEVLDLFTFPTFYTEVAQARKAYSIGYYTLDLHVGGI